MSRSLGRGGCDLGRCVGLLHVIHCGFMFEGREFGMILKRPCDGRRKSLGESRPDAWVGVGAVYAGAFSRSVSSTVHRVLCSKDGSRGDLIEIPQQK